MKFQIQHLKECLNSTTTKTYARLGLLSLKNGVECETPACMMYSTSGGVPHITYDLLHLLPYKSNIIELPLPTV
jgi:hypothetical protein